MSTEIVKTPAEQAVEKVKNIRLAWGEMGVQISTAKESLINRGKNAIASLKIPKTFEDVKEAEVILASANKEKTSIETDRKAFTSKFKTVADQLMQPEKDLDAAILLYTPHIIRLKKEQEAINVLQTNKNAEIARIKEWAKNAITNWDATCKQTIVAKVSAAYEHALGTGAIELADLPDYFTKVLTGIKARNLFTPTPLETYNCNYISKEELTATLTGFSFTPVADYEADFEKALNDVFKDYDLAIKDKANALRIADEQRKKDNATIDNERAASTTMNTMVANAEVFNAAPISETKALKKTYVLDETSMPETFENAIKILAAFLAAGQKAKEKTTVNKWFGFSAKHAMTALAKMKSEDNDFHPNGIIFKLVEKL